MSLALLTTDLHLAENSRDAYRFTFIEKLEALIVKHRIETLFILGDLTEEKDRHSAYLLNQVTDAIAILAKHCAVVILRGNHDGKDAMMPYWAFLRHIPRVVFINEPRPLALKDCPFGKFRCMMLPHTRNWERDWKGLDFKGFQFAFVHGTFEGVKAEGGFVLDGIPLSIFPKRLRVYAGDIHSAQETPPVTYIGAPYTVDFGDDYDPRVLIIDGGPNEKSLPVPGIQKRLVEVIDDGKLDGRALDRAAAKAKCHEGDIVKVRISMVQASASNFPAMRERIEKWAQGAKLALHIVQPVVVAPNGRMTEGRREKMRLAARDDKSTLADYVASRQMDEPTHKTGLFLMQRADK